MLTYILLALLPAVRACTNPESDPCASFMAAKAPTASPFCNTFTKSVVTTTAGLPAWASVCSNKPSALSKECSCAFTAGGGVGGGTPTTMKTSTMIPSQPITAGGSSGGGGGGSNTCGSAAVDGLVGFGAGTTGGGSSAGTTVTSCSAFKSAAAGGGVIRINGMLTGCGVIDVKGGTSVLGVGSSSGMTDGGIRLKNVQNVIIRNLKMHNPPVGEDLISLTGSSKVWIDHCDLSTVGLTGDKDYYDGLLDITHASDSITVSWTKFHDHWKGSLIGHSDDNGSEDTGHLHVTYHHCYWTNVNSRLPSIRFGTGHIYSSCYENNPTSGINSRINAQVLVENCAFTNTKLAIVTDLDSDQAGYATSKNNIFSNSNTRITRTSSFSPSYSYALDSASCICNLVKSSAGVGVVSF